MNLENINKLKITIKEWLDLSSVYLTDDELISCEISPIIYNAQAIRTFNRLTSTFDMYQMRYLFDFNGTFNFITKSNVYRHIFPNELTFNEHSDQICYYNGFEIIIKVTKKDITKATVPFLTIPYLTHKQRYSLMYTHYADLLQKTIENFNLLLKQDNILNDYAFKVAIYNKDNNMWCGDAKKIQILLLNTKKLITLNR